MRISRRDFLLRGGAAALFGLLPPPARAFLDERPRHERRRGFGCAVGLDNLVNDPQFAQTVTRYCVEIVPEYELKWSFVRPDLHSFRFDHADALHDFAQRNGMTMRGHTLAWYAALPEWLNSLDASGIERALTVHIETLVSHFAGRLTSWDVVNEAIAEKPRTSADRRPSIWTQHLGDRYIPLAFRTAAAADPKAKLALNEYDIEFVGAQFATKRAGLRRLAFQLLDAGAPLHAIGLQCHLRGATPIDRDGVTRFCEDMREAGLEIYVTELDVIDRDLPGPSEVRDAIVAARTRELLEAIAAGAPPARILTWGITDRYSWINQTFKRSDGLHARPLPFDVDYRIKPMFEAIAAHAPVLL